MDLSKLSPSPKPPSPGLKGGDEEQQDEVDASASRPSEEARDVEMEKQREMGSAGDGHFSGAVPHQKGAVDKHRFNTVGYQKRHKQKLVSDFATFRKGNAKPRAALKQALFYQGVSDKSTSAEEQVQLESLRETLDSFPLRVLPDWRNGGGICEVSGLPLEDSWTVIVHSHLTMDKTERHQQEALWEMIYTELSYIYKLTIVTHLVMGALTHLHRHGFLREVTHELIFSNLPSVLNAHCRFWQEVMFPMLEEVRRTGAPFDPIRLEEGCMQFRERFSAYLQYCWEEERIVEFARRLMDNNPQFRAYITWVEAHPSCGRMRLGDIQAKPHQRITKYPLLLAAVLKATQGHKSQYAVRKMLNSVNGFLDSINEHLKLKDEELELSDIAQKIEGYEVVEGISEEIDKHIRNFCRFDLTSPIQGAGPRVIRRLLLEETLRIRDRRESKWEAVVLLFSDVLLLAKAQRKSEKLKVIRPPMALERLECVALKDDCSFMLVEIGELGCPVSVYVITAPSPDSRSQWVSSIKAAQVSLATMRKKERTQGLGSFFQSDTQLVTQANPPSEETLSMLNNNMEDPRYSAEIRHILSSNDQERNSASLSDDEKSPLQEMEGKDQYQSPQEKWDFRFFSKSFMFSQSAPEDFASIRGSAKRLGFNYLEMSELESKEDSESIQKELHEIIFHGFNERRVTWNNSTNASPEVSKQIKQKTSSSRKHSDYNNSLTADAESDLESLSSQSEPRDLLCGKNHSLKNRTSWEESKRDSCISQSEEDDLLADTWRFSRKLKSPRLRRRRPLGTQQSPPLQTHNKTSLLLDANISLPKSSSDSNLDGNQMLGWGLDSSEQGSNTEDADTLESISKNQVTLWSSPPQGNSPVTQAIPVAQLPNRKAGQNSQKKPRLKSQTSFSAPDTEPQGGQGPGMIPAWLDSSISFYSHTKLASTLQASSLEDILKRATARKRDRQRPAEKFEWRKCGVLDSIPFTSQSTLSSLYPSEGKKEEILEISQKGQDMNGEAKKEDDSNGELIYSFFYGDGASVDWTGWCFDDDEVMHRLDPEENGVSVDQSEIPTSVQVGKLQEDQQSSEV